MEHNYFELQRRRKGTMQKKAIWTTFQGNEG